MKKNIIIMSSILLVVACLGVGGVFFFQQQQKEQKAEQAKKQSQVAKKEKEAVKEEETKKEQALAQKPKPIDKNQKTAYLTIDDGPTKYFKRIVEALKKENVKATFFFVGNNIKDEYKADIKQAVQDGNSIGMHSMSHDANKLYKQSQFIPEMEQESKLLSDIVGKKVGLIRAPYGSTYLNNDQVQKAKADKFRLLDWNIDSNDWKHKGKPQDTVSFVSQELDGFHKISPVILVHETEDTLDAIPALVKAIRAKGFVLEPYFEDNDFHLNFKKDPDL
ncbi:polysaccharide deacetylase family protein [Listeria booriae]|uniref:polysaccharide deacetylase family protein n=1 Tax=Listeria booriae TaxID=1552123 RepID=UPI0016258422|nr:polysaccharide deacetylase family protein [Listeria booriae]MBC1891646.1 polysaccharide deacetylase family protein [Listeria booriae]MBC1896678.1 polysaccharide deacetylase family protein [Listeria booriae]MBC1906486.1 polysaccharide deacetylase family protein [Listeria booriae]